MKNYWIVLIVIIFIGAIFYYDKKPVEQRIYRELPPAFANPEDKPLSQEVENLRAKDQLERNKLDHSISKKERHLDTIEKHHQLKEKEEDLRKEGVLPPKPDHAIGINGKKYQSYSEFKQTKEYQDWIAIQNAKHYWRDQKAIIDKNYEAKRQRELYQKLNDRESMKGALGWIEKKRAPVREKMTEYMGHSGPWLKDRAYIPSKDEDDIAREKYDELIRKYDAMKGKVFEPIDPAK